MTASPIPLVPYCHQTKKFKCCAQTTVPGRWTFNHWNEIEWKFASSPTVFKNICSYYQCYGLLTRIQIVPVPMLLSNVHDTKIGKCCGLIRIDKVIRMYMCPDPQESQIINWDKYFSSSKSRQSLSTAYTVPVPVHCVLNTGTLCCDAFLWGLNLSSLSLAGSCVVMLFCEAGTCPLFP